MPLCSVQRPGTACVVSSSVAFSPSPRPLRVRGFKWLSPHNGAVGGSSDAVTWFSAACISAIYFILRHWLFCASRLSLFYDLFIGFFWRHTCTPSVNMERALTVCRRYLRRERSALPAFKLAQVDSGTFPLISSSTRNKVSLYKQRPDNFSCQRIKFEKEISRACVPSSHCGS